MERNIAVTEYERDCEISGENESRNGVSIVKPGVLRLDLCFGMKTFYQPQIPGSSGSSMESKESFAYGKEVLLGIQQITSVP